MTIKFYIFVEMNADHNFSLQSNRVRCMSEYFKTEYLMNNNTNYCIDYLKNM